MSTAIGYSASHDDLYSPCKNAQFFPTGEPPSEAALCAELARLAYCRNSPSLTLDREHIAGVLTPIGFVASDFFDSGGTHCFLAQRPKGLSVVAFRGTDADDPRDLGEDADFILSSWKQGGGVHTGFAKALKTILPDLENALQRIDGRVLFTGHSLGAAMATLLASVSKPDALYTFGSPMVGDPDFVQTLSAVTNFRFVDCCDLVARMPFHILGYAHIGFPHYIDCGRHVSYNPDAGSVEADQIQASAKYLAEYAFKEGNIKLRGLADHAPINYVLPISADRSLT